MVTLLVRLLIHLFRVPTCTEKPGIPGKMREVFTVREKSNNLKILTERRGIFVESGKILAENNKILITK